MSPSYEQRTLGHVLKDEGITRVIDHTPDSWKAAADDAIARLARSGRVFTAEDVRIICGDPPGHPNAFGARFNVAARARIIRPVTYTWAKRATRHASILRSWVGTGALR